jgi:IS30 family transposase
MSHPRYSDPVLESEKRQIIEAREAGMSCYAIAKELGRARSTISDWIKRLEAARDDT